ncbi:MAG: FAD:protein FMN transferase [Undibacterium sp.]|nr:FAD:protein FMN transferase [Opitutaceae bacterium]
MAIVLNNRRTPPPPAPASSTDIPLRHLEWHALGTRCQVQYAATAPQARAFEAAAVGWVAAFEAKYSRSRPASLPSGINAAAGLAPVPIDAEMEQLLALCDRLHFMTQGVLDPTSLPLLRLWDYKATSPRLPTDAEIAAARRLVGWKKIQRTPGRVFLPEPGMALDFGGFGKEWAVDIVAQIARDHGITAALVDFGHDLRAVGLPSGRPAWHIGLEDPAAPGATKGSLALTRGQGVASSGDYLRRVVIGGVRYGHIVDPPSGRPVANGCLQATIIAPTCLQAGVLSTAAFVLGVTAGLDLIQAQPGAEGQILTDKTRAQTRGFWNYVAT